jgi:hypothetical protein
MAQPSTYNRQASFQDYQAASPSAPISGTDLDSEFNQVKITLDEILQNMALLQRDDGDLANESVGNDQLAPALAIGFNSPTQWLTATDYIADTDTVFNDNKFYVCRTTHTSGTFATDLAAVKWELLADLSTANTIDDGSLANAKLADMAASTIKGRRTSTGVPEDLTLAQAQTLLQIDTGAIANARLANMSADTIKGRANGAGTGAPTDLTATQVRTILGVIEGPADQSEAEAGSDNTKAMTSLRTKQASDALVPATKHSWSVPQRASVETPTFSATYTPDLSAAPTKDMTLTGDITSLGLPTNCAVHDVFQLIFRQDGSGGHTITVASGWLDEPVWTTTANEVDIVDCQVFAVSGTTATKVLMTHRYSGAI